MTARLGIDLGGTYCKLGLVDEQGQLTRHLSIPTPESFDQAMDAIAAAAREILAAAGIGPADLPFVGIGVPSTVHPLTGRLVLANNKGWENAPLKEALELRLQVPVLVANDADCALAGEVRAGAAKGKQSVLLVTLGTGVGGAVLIDGRLYPGGDGMGMEVGHSPLIAGGWPCTCGAEGCLECYVSATGLIKLTEETRAVRPDSLLARLPGPVSGETAFEAAKQGDSAGLQVIDIYSAWLAQGLGGLVNIFRPELVLLGGGVSHAGVPLFDRVNALLPRFILAYDVIGGPTVRQAGLGNDAGIIGAATLDTVQGRR